MLDEAHRVLRPGGTFVLTAPFAGATAWADPLDLKRRLPWLFAPTSASPAINLRPPPEIGHRNVTDAELRELLAGRFVLEEYRYTGPVTVFLLWLPCLGVVRLRLPAAIVSRINAVRGWESGVRRPRRLAFSVRLVARRLT